MAEQGAVTSDARRRLWPRYLAGFLGFVVVILLFLLGYIGAFGGPLYVDFPARGVSPAARDDVAAVIFSGDMGLKLGMGPRIAARLTAAGIPVTGVNSLVYFRKRRSPGEVEAYVAAAMAHAIRANGARKLILIGQSYGADMLHVGLAGLPAAERRPIILVALVVPTEDVYFRISPAEWFEWPPPDALALPTARALTWVPVLCVRGVEEKASLCPMLHQPNVEHVVLPGGHALHGDSPALAAPLLDKVRAILSALHD